MKKRNAAIGGGIIVVILAALSVIFGVDLFSELGVDPPEGLVLTETGSQPINIDPNAGGAEPSNWYEIYFTNPTCPPEEARVGGVDELIAADILAAERRVDVAAFDLDSVVMTEALMDRETAGVEVRVVTDEDNGDLSSIRRLRNNGTSVVEDKRTGLMHDKFVVIDGRILWVGSLNYTTNGVYCNNNNVVRIESPRLAANYTAEMDEMYNDKLFGPTSPNATPNENLIIQGVEVENYFGPEKELAPIIARTVVRAQNEILFLAFSFTDDQIGEAMLGRADAGVQIRGVFETVGADTSFSYYPLLQSANLPNVQARLDGNPNIMHHKVFIIDRETVIFGSFNFSDSANRRNDENILIVHDPVFASFFVEEFETVWQEAK
ncbi:MAG: phospholipase D-like domain-containing protein [Candidatus Promineifilaceae bacterium]